MSTDMPSINLSEQQRQMLAELANQVGKPWETVYREAIENYRSSSAANDADNGQGSFYESMQDVIGIVKDTPKDLSTNPKYIEGFGRSRK